MLSCSWLTVTPPVYKLLRSRHIFASVAYQILPSHEIGVAAIRINKKSSLLLLSCFILGYYKCGRSFSHKNASAGTLQLNNCKIIRCPKKTVPVNIFLIQCTCSWSKNGVICVSNTAFGPKSAPKRIFGVELFKGTHHERRLTSTTRGASPLPRGAPHRYHKGRLPPTTRGASPHHEGRLPPP